MNKPSQYFFRNQTDFLKENFVIDNETLLKEFNSSVEHFCFFTLEMDKIIDNDYNYPQMYENNTNTPYLAIKSHMKSVKGLSKIFPDDHLFWKILDDHQLQYYSGLLKEKFDSRQQTLFTLQNFEEYAVNKHCLAYIPILGMDFLFTSKESADNLVDIHTSLFKAIQMNDDIEDFQTDLVNKQWTYAHSQVHDFIIKNNLSNTSNLDRFEERVLYVSGIASELAHYSRENFMIARNKAQKCNFQKIASWLDEVLSQMDENIKLIENLVTS
ncbi:hypothetical protein [Chryseobacterium sp.]|mgnify:CR=1 FL=1|uniref:hypothetical protein n=1 Tax=Chryseobacterium sp. TaxID=1871047 RepID=UPI0025B811A2|nr:hypothetical protein [Chryseobacterium sp.]